MGMIRALSAVPPKLGPPGAIMRSRKIDELAADIDDASDAVDELQADTEVAPGADTDKLDDLHDTLEHASEAIDDIVETATTPTLTTTTEASSFSEFVCRTTFHACDLRVGAGTLPLPRTVPHIRVPTTTPSSFD